MSESFDYDVFLSHSAKDKAVVREIAERLRTEGLRVWFDEWVIMPGDNIQSKIEVGLERSRVLVLCMSANAFGSDWSLSESYTFRFRDPLNKERRFIPLRLDDVPIKGTLAPLKNINWNSGAKAAAFDELLKACRVVVETIPFGRETASHQRITDVHRGEPSLSGVPIIAIVGLGFAGTTTAIRLMQLASVPIKLLLFEQSDEQLYGGLAYGASTLIREHYLNIQAGRISIYRERPDDFLQWATEDADRSKWFEALRISDEERGLWTQHLSFEEFSPVPRLIYQMYLRHRFQDAVSFSEKNVKLERISAPVVDLDEIRNDDRILTRLHFKQGEVLQSVNVDAAVLCTGHLAPLLPGFAREVRDEASFFPDPYHRRYAEGISASTEDDKLLIIGSGLSAYDAAISALARGFKGKITMCSRNGLKHGSYAFDHSHQILSSSVFDRHFQPQPCTAQQMLDAIRLATETGKEVFRRHFPGEHPGVIPERVLKAVEPYIATFVRNAPSAEVKDFLRHRSWFTTMRTSVVPIVSQRVLRSGVSFLAREITGITRTNHSTLRVQYAEDQKGPVEQYFSKIACCAGYDPDYCHATGLWDSIMQKLAIPHFKTGLGITVGDNGRVRRKWDNSLSRSLYAVGTMRQGDEIERRGRIGAFTFSIGTIRNQCLMTALSILKNFEMREYSCLAQAERENIRHQIRDLLGETREVRRYFNSVVSDIADAQFLPNTQGRDEWVSDLQEKVHRLIDTSNRDPADVRLMQHALWHFARMEAGRQMTNIRRLHERYAVVRSYRPGVQNRCVPEKKECKDQLKRIMSQLQAKSVSLSVYHEHARCLYPFVDHLRLNRFTPTPYGEGNAGRLVRAYVEDVDRNRLYSDSGFFPEREVKTVYSEKNRLVGIIIPDYNVTRAKKKVYTDENPRLYPQVLAMLVLDREAIVGVVYLEAPKVPVFEFRLNDVQRVQAVLGKIPFLLSRVIPKWDPREDTDLQDQRWPGLKKEPGADMSHFNCTNCILEDAVLNGVNLNNAVLNGARCKGTSFNDAKMRSEMIGTNFEYASLERADLSAATIVGANFTRAKLTKCIMEAAIVEKTTFAHAVMTSARIGSITMRGVDFSYVSFRKAQLLNLTFDSSCRWDDADLTGCVLDQTTYENLPDEIVEKFRDTFTFLHTERH